jgi:hypothetical protein
MKMRAIETISLMLNRSEIAIRGSASENLEKKWVFWRGEKYEKGGVEFSRSNAVKPLKCGHSGGHEGKK